MIYEKYAEYQGEKQAKKNKARKEAEIVKDDYSVPESGISPKLIGLKREEWRSMVPLTKQVAKITTAVRGCLWHIKLRSLVIFLNVHNKCRCLYTVDHFGSAPNSKMIPQVSWIQQNQKMGQMLANRFQSSKFQIFFVEIDHGNGE